MIETYYSFFSFSESTLITTEIGTAKRIPINPNTNPHTTIQRKTTSGLTPSVLFMTIGVRTLFSVHCATAYTQRIAMIPGHPRETATTSNAGTEPRIGQI